jgi:serine phosphatase RsbU (regulator of sigma subunit)
MMKEPTMDTDPTILAIMIVGGAVSLALWLWQRKGSSWDLVSPHLRELPIRRLRYLLAGRFFFSASTAFFLDVLFRGAMPRTWLLIFAVLCGSIGPVVLLIRRRPAIQRFLVVLALTILLQVVFFIFLAHHGKSSLTVDAEYRFDAVAILISMVISSRLYLLHINTEGARQLRAEAELELAHRLQKVLVPGVMRSNARLEVYGRSIPSEQVGGDLVDLIASEEKALVYLLDVTGHGIPAGALMGSFKTAVHMAFPQPMPEMLDRINRVLPALKQPHMLATFAALAFEANRESVEYTLAGHLPILHYRAGGEVEQMAFEQLPLGLFEADRYVSRSSPCRPGDLFALYSDGIVEAANAAGEEYGIERLKSEIRSRLSQPLEQICDAVMTASAAHWIPDDDRSLLLVRVLR